MRKPGPSFRTWDWPVSCVLLNVDGTQRKAVDRIDDHKLEGRNTTNFDHVVVGRDLDDLVRIDSLRRIFAFFGIESRN